jgi:cobalt-zinc-cadmium efflux system outer membrane protein
MTLLRFLPRHSFAIVLLTTSCARVVPEGDYQNARQVVTERTGSESVYDPVAEETIEQAVDTLLQNGLTTDEAVRTALLNNKEFQALFAELGASRADVVQSGLLTNPSISFMAKFPGGGGRSDLTFGFGQELVDLWQIPVRRKIAEAQLEQTVLKIVRRAVDIAADVRIRYYRIIAIKRAEAITKENLKLVERSLQLAQARYTAGESGQLDVFLVRGTLLEVQLQLISIARDRRVAEAELARLLGLVRWNRPIELNEELGPTPAVVIDETELLKFAMQERLDAQAAALQIRAAQGEVSRQYLSIFSNVTVGAEYERLESRALPGRNVLADTARTSVAHGTLTAPDIQSRGQREIEKRQIIDSIFGPSFQITLPIWDQNQAQIAKAGYKLQEAHKDYEALLDQVAQDVEQATAVIQSAQELVLFYEQQMLPQAQKNVDAAMRSYQAGEQNIIALIEAQRSLIGQRRAFVDVVRDCAIAKAELERALGGRLPAGATSRPTANQPTTTEAQ